MNYVYRYMDGNDWVYVGKASAMKVRNELQNRIRSHSKDDRFKKYVNAKIEYCMFENKSDMDITEMMLIKLHKPIINKAGVTDSELPFTYDDSKIQWFDIKDFVRNRKSIEEEIQDEKLKELIYERSVTARKESIWFRNPTNSNMPSDPLVKEFANYIYSCADKWFVNNKEAHYPECIFEFEISLADLMFELDYQTTITASTFSRKLKEKIKEVYPDRSEYSIDMKHNGNQFTIRVMHLSQLWRNVANTILRIGDVKT